MRSNQRMSIAWRGWGIRLIMLGILSAGGIAAYYLGLKSGLEPVATEVLLPTGPFQHTSKEDLSTEPQDLASYFAEFSPYYFGLTNRFPSHYYSLPDLKQYGLPRTELIAPEHEMAPPAPVPAASRGDGAPSSGTVSLATHRISQAGETPEESHEQLWRVILKNSSPYRSQFIGTMRVDVQLSRLVHFPWELLTVTPNLHVQPLGLDQFELLNTGIGPALDISWLLRTPDGLALGRGIVPMVFDEPESVNYLTEDFRFPTGQVNCWPVVVADEPTPGNGRLPQAPADELEVPTAVRLLHPLFLRLPSEAIRTDDAEYFEYDGNWYETVWTVDRLAKITRVEYRTPAVTHVEYMSIAGRSDLHNAVHDLPAGVLFYVRADGLLERDPRLSILIAPEKRVKTATYSVARHVAEAIAMPPVQPKGVDLLVKSVRVSLKNLAIGEQASKSIEINEYLNPSGQLVLYLVVSEPTNARYQTRVHANGEQVHSFSIRTFVPTVTRFPKAPDSRTIEIDRLRRVFQQYETATTGGAER